VVNPAAISLASTNKEFSLRFKNVILSAGALTVSLFDVLFYFINSSTEL